MWSKPHRHLPSYSRALSYPTQPSKRDWPQYTMEDQPLIPSKRSSTPLPKRQLAIILFARLAEPIAYTQIFPYIAQVSALCPSFAKSRSQRYILDGRGATHCNRQEENRVLRRLDCKSNSPECNRTCPLSDVNHNLGQSLCISSILYNLVLGASLG